MKRTLLISAIAAFTLAHAPFAHAAPAEEDKTVLAQRVVSLWQIENAAVVAAQRPASDILLKSRVAIQGRLSEEKQAATMKEVGKAIQKYVDEATPIVKASAERLKGSTLVPLLVQNFSAEELRQLVTLFELPVKKKFESLAPQFERTFIDKVSESTAATVNPKGEAMNKEVGLAIRSAAMAP